MRTDKFAFANIFMCFAIVLLLSVVIFSLIVKITDLAFADNTDVSKEYIGLTSSKIIEKFGAPDGLDLEKQYKGRNVICIDRNNLTKNASNDEMFAYVDGCLYYRAYIPKSESAKRLFLTQDQIDAVFTEIVNPLLNQPVPLKWLCADNV